MSITMNSQHDLSTMLLDARALRACWRAELARVATTRDGDHEVLCEYQISIIDGLIALLSNLLPPRPH
jgi:hypothetical protein